MMGRTEALRELEAMGYHVVANDNGIALRIDEHTLPLGDEPHWPDALARAKNWIDELSAEVGRKGHALAERRRKLGYRDCAAFCELTGLDEGEVFEAEAGLARPRAVHLRILDWLESGELRPRDRRG